MDPQRQYPYSHKMWWLKIAVAVAIIRNKPPRLSSRKYTEILQIQFLSLQSQKQKKCCEKELQQNSVLSSCTAVDKIPSENCQISLEAANMVRENDGLFSGSLCDGEDDDDREVCMLENSKFVHSMIELQELARLNQNLQTGVLMDAAVTHIHTLRAVLDQDILTLSESCLCECAESIMTIAGSIPWTDSQPHFMQEVCSFVDTIIYRVLHSSRYEHFKVLGQKRTLVNMLLVFMKGKALPLQSSILDSLVELVETFCHRLKISQHSFDILDPEFYENGYFVFQCLELTMKMWSLSCPIDVCLLQEAQTRLDRSVLQIAHCFQLVAQTLLRVTALIEGIIQNK